MADHSKAHIRAKFQLKEANADTPVRDKVFPKSNRKRKLAQSKDGARNLIRAVMSENRKRAKAQNTDSNN